MGVRILLRFRLHAARLHHNGGGAHLYNDRRRLHRPQCRGKEKKMAVSSRVSIWEAFLKEGIWEILSTRRGIGRKVSSEDFRSNFIDVKEC